MQLIPIWRIEENRELMRNYLVKTHVDRDDDSLYIRFAEIMSNYQELIFYRNLNERVSEILTNSEGILF